jgi:hypothetical protein
LYNWNGQTPIGIAEEAWDVEKRRVGPAPEVLQAMNAGTPIPEVKTAKTTIALMRELLGWPAWTDADFGGPASTAAPTPAAAPAATQAAGGQ